MTLKIQVKQKLKIPVSPLVVLVQSIIESSFIDCVF